MIQTEWITNTRNDTHEDAAITVVYDGNCVICRQSVALASKLDWRHRIEQLDMHDWDAVQRRFPTIEYGTAMGQVHVIDRTGEMFVGYFGTRRMMRELPLLSPLWLFLHLPGMTWLGQRVYGFIARNRYTINRWMGAPICESDSCVTPSHNVKAESTKSR